MHGPRAAPIVLLLLAIGSAAAAPTLGPATVRELRGPARVGASAALREGDSVRPGDTIALGDEPGSRVELAFADGSLVRLTAGSTLRLVPGERRVELSRGRCLVHSDRMVGGIEVTTPTVELFPEGTTFLVEIVDDNPARGGPNAPGVDVTVLEGVVRALSRGGNRGDAVILPGETLHLDGERAPGKPSLRRLLALLVEEPLIAAAAHPLASVRRIRELGDQQRRGVLTGRNQRLRGELLWRRPADSRVTVVPDRASAR